MRALIQRVSQASVTVEGQIIGEIERRLAAILHNDAAQVAIRIFAFDNVEDILKG